MDKFPLKLERIRELLPHRYPMLFVDRVLEVSGTDVVAEKLVSANEPFFAGHFPDRPIMPGVLILEAIAQTAALYVFLNEPENVGRDIALVGVNSARFRRPVVPGDILRLSTRVLRKRRRTYQYEGTATVRGEIVAESEFMAVIVDWEEKT